MYYTNSTFKLEHNTGETKRVIRKQNFDRFTKQVLQQNNNKYFFRTF